MKIINISELADEINIPQDVLLDVIKEMREKELANSLIIDKFLVIIEDKDISIVKGLQKDKNVSLLDLANEIGADVKIVEEILRWMSSKKLISDDWAKRIIENKKVEVREALGERVFIAGNRRYKIVKRIGGGGAAEVYEALDEGGNKVALKIYISSDKEFIDEVGKLKFLTEKLGKTIYVVNVLDTGLGNLKGVYRPYVVMDYYPMNLETLIHNRTLGLKNGVKIMVKITKILAYASSIGVHHGDLKPQNILIREEGGRFYPAVGDWGGGYTLCYSAPEVYKHGTKAISEKSDVWSFGVILYEVLTHNRLFKDEFDYEKRIEEDIKVDIQHIPKLENLINSCLVRDSEKRPSFREIMEKLDAYLREELGTFVSKDYLDIHIEKIIQQSENVKDEEIVAKIEKILEKSKSAVVVDAENLLKCARIIREINKARQAMRSGDFRNALHQLEYIYNDIINIADADKELSKKLEPEVNSLRTLNHIQKSYTVDMGIFLKKDFEKIELFFDEIMDIISQIMVCLIIKK